MFITAITLYAKYFKTVKIFFIIKSKTFYNGHLLYISKSYMKFFASKLYLYTFASRVSVLLYIIRLVCTQSSYFITSRKRHIEYLLKFASL